MTKQLYYGDNLDVLRDPSRIGTETIDLCYIDPPFNSKRDYNQIYNNIGAEDRAQAIAFTDTWVWDTRATEGYAEIAGNHGNRFQSQTIELIKGLKRVLGEGSLLAYLVSMTLRIVEIHRVLKSTGSFYLHCDPTASHYLKLVLDTVFCANQDGEFRNEIIWHYGGWSKTKYKQFSRKHDVLLFYTKSQKNIFNPVTEPWGKEEYIKNRRQKIYKEEDGREYVWADGRNTVKRYIDQVLEEGKAVDTVWNIRALTTSSRERLGYPTQKPETLLERIIKASSNEGDTILDAYCGCGTTIAVAERLRRKWVGIDITYQSIALVMGRLQETFGAEIEHQIKIAGIPRDMEAARALATKRDDRLRKEFEKWAILTYTGNRAIINDKKGADGGIDGKAYFQATNTDTANMVFQVKSGAVGRSDIATLRGDMEKFEAATATLITLNEPTAPMKLEANSAGVYYHPLMGRNYNKIQIVTIKEILEQNKRLELPMSYTAIKAAQLAAQAGQLAFEL